MFLNQYSMRSEIGTDITMPRITKQQINHANVDAANQEEFFRRTIYIPMLDALISDIISRFGK